MYNVNPSTGVRCGVISGNSLDPEILSTLMDDGDNLSFREVSEELQRGVEREADAIEEEAEIAAAEIGGMTDDEAESWIAHRIEIDYDKRGYPDRDAFIDGEFQRRIEHVEIDEPIIEGKLDGVTYRISWLGGAPLVWALNGPCGYAARLCSPCVPNAADLDAGFVEGLDDESTGFLCYVVPKDWLAGVDQREAA